MANLISVAHQLLISRFGKINRLMGKVIERQLAPLGITYQEMRIAGLLMGEENITQKALAQKLSVRAATLSVAISKLEIQGLVKRVPSKKDKRVNFLHLIPGNKIAKVDELLTTLESDITEGIPKEELQVSSKVFEQIIKNLQTLERKQL